MTCWNSTAVITTACATKRSPESKEIFLADYANYAVSVDNIATALLIDGSASSGDIVWLVDNLTFNEDQIIQLFNQGVDVVKDGNGEHTNALPQIAAFYGDQSRALVGGSARLDYGTEVIASDDLNRFKSLSVKITNRVANEDRLDLIRGDGLTIAGDQIFLSTERLQERLNGTDPTQLDF